MDSKEDLFKLKNFIGGKFLEPTDLKYIDNYDPSIGKVYSLVPDSNEKDIELAIESAKSAFPIWSSKTTQERSSVLYKIADELEKRIKEFSQAESRDQGKGVSLSSTLDIPRSVANLRFFAGAILHHKDEAYHGIAANGFVNYTIKLPVGVVGLISPWNLPLYLLTWKLAPAIAVGNTCVCKPSEMTSMTAYLFSQVCKDAGLPDGVVNMVFGTGPNAGAPLVKHPQVPLISFTGGTKTGEIVSIQSAPHNKKLSLELGGKNPALIFEDCKFDECVEQTVRSSFYNQGEVCLCTSRIFVQDTIFDKFVSAFVEKAKQIVIGDPQLESTQMGALISLDHLKKIEYYVDLAKQEGGKILTGGKRAQVGNDDSPLRNGYFYEPTIITNLKPSGRVMQEEIFGPVVVVCPFSTEQEALKYANDIEYGLASTVWSQNVDRCHRVSRQIESGITWVNCWMIRDLRTPFGGCKKSGVGREGGDYSIDFYTEQKNICLKIN